VVHVVTLSDGPGAPVLLGALCGTSLVGDEVETMEPGWGCRVPVACFIGTPWRSPRRYPPVGSGVGRYAPAQICSCRGWVREMSQGSPAARATPVGWVQLPGGYTIRWRPNASRVDSAQAIQPVECPVGRHDHLAASIDNHRGV
jgi:hypothetical protein